MDPLHRRDTSVLRPVEIFVIFIVTFFLMLLFGVAMTLLWGSKTATLLGEFLIIVPGLSYVWFKRLPLLRVFRIHRINYAVLLYTFLTAIPLFILSDELDRLISSVFPMPEIFVKGMEEFVKIHSFGDALILFVAAVLMAGVAEEMLFRGLLQRSLEFHLEPAMAIVITAAFFAVVHLNPWMALQITFLGLVFGWMAWKSNSILPTIILHGLNNLFSIVMINVPEEKLTWYLSGDHVRLLWLIPSVLIFIPLIIKFSQASNEMKSQRSKGELVE